MELLLIFKSMYAMLMVLLKLDGRFEKEVNVMDPQKAFLFEMLVSGGILFFGALGLLLLFNTHLSIAEALAPLAKIYSQLALI